MESSELLLSIEGIAVHRVTENQEPVEVARGQMDLLALQENNQFVLRIADATFSLEKDVQIVKGRTNCYMMLHLSDMFCFTANPPIPEEIAEVLEMTFADSCQFIRESEGSAGLELVEVVECDVVDPLVQPQEATEGKLKRLFHRGKAKLKVGLEKGAALAFVTYLKAKVYLKKRLGKKKQMSRPQQPTDSLSQAVVILKEMEREAAPIVPPPDNVLDDILQSYGRMSQHLAQHKPPH